MKILVINPILFTSEKNVIPEIRTIKETMIYGMCQGFMANGHQVTLAAAADFRPITAEADYAFDVLFFKSVLKRVFLPALLPLSLDLYKYLKVNHYQFDLVVCSEVFAFSSLFAAIVCPAKTVIWHEMTIHQKKFRQLPSRCWHRMVVPLFMRKVKCVIPRSDNACRFISKYMKQVSKEPVDHGVNISRFGFSKEKDRQIISSSRLVRGKNIESIILIYSKLIKINGYEDVRLLIAGDGDFRKELEALVAQLDLQSQVTFLGYLQQHALNEAIRRSYVSMFNTLRDQNMLSISESVVSGTPVMTNLLPALSGFVAKERVGIAKDNWDETDLVTIIANNSFYVDNCFNCREKMSIESCAQKIVNLFLSTGN